jgi:uncharacterized protein (TIRG00374 family)
MRAYRWGFLLRAIQNIAFSYLFSATSIGLMANNLLPARLGEFVRAYDIGRRNVNAASAFATIVVERILDLFVLLSFLAVILVLFPFPGWMARSGYLLFLLNAAALGFLVLLRTSPNKVERFCASIMSPIPGRLPDRLMDLLRSFVHGLEILGDVWGLVIAGILSVGVWLMMGLAVWSCCLAFGFSLPIYAPLVILVIISAGIMIPFAPGFVGTFQFFSVKGLCLFGVPGDQALSFSIAFHATQFIPITLIGLFCLWMSRVSLGQAVRAKAKA